MKSDTEVGDRAWDRLTPLTPAIFHIMLALARGERHGYAVMLDVEELTGGQMHLGPGTLYRSIQRMLVDGLIEELEEKGEADPESERRRYYRLTPLGERVARAEARRLEALVEAARKQGWLSPHRKRARQRR